MYPVLFKIGNFPITSFGLMMFLAFITAAYVTGRQLDRYGMKRELAWDLLAVVAIGGILGAKIYYIALHWSDLMAAPLHELTSRGGLVWYGGLMGGVLAYFFQIRRQKLPAAVMFDATAPALAIAYAVGRTGCFLVGDDYGLPTNGPFGIAFPNGSPPSTAGYLRSVGAHIPAAIPNSQVVTVHPTQLYEIGMALIMFAILWRIGARRLRRGQLFALYMVLYGIERFLIEFVRAKGDRFVLGLSTSQLASIALLALGSWLWFHQGRTAAPVPQPEAATVKGKRKQVASTPR